MKHQAIRIDFTPRELWYFLFRKKICPRCGGRLEKHKKWETRLGSEFASSGEEFLAGNMKVKYGSYFFCCPSCGGRYSLTRLAEGK